MRAWWLGAALVLSSTLASGQRLVFTMLTPPTSPVALSSISSSRDFGFQSAHVRNDSAKAVEAIRFRVMLTTFGGRNEWADGGRVFVKLDPGERKTTDIFLGRIAALTQRARELKLEIARAVIVAEAVDFADGTQWTDDGPSEGIPIDPRPLPR